MQNPPCDPSEVRKEWGAGENDRVLYENKFLKKKDKHTTNVSDSNSKEEKDPEVQMKPLARRSTFVGHPEHEEPKQPSCVEENCEISLYVKRSISISDGR